MEEEASAKASRSSIYITSHVCDRTQRVRQFLLSLCSCCLKLLKHKERQVSAMQEDVLGTRRTAISETYINCARCNKVTRLRYARIIQSDVLSDSHSEFEYLCPECQKALADGEKDLPIV